jgi:hypothetical protein
MKKLASLMIMIILSLSLVCSCGPAPSPSTPTPEPSVTPISPTLAPTPSPLLPTATSIPRVLLPVRGLYVSFDRRNFWLGYYPGYVITHYNEIDPVLGHTISEEVSLQLDQIKQMGVNTIAYQLQSSNSTYSDPHLTLSLPSCNISPDLGLQYPQPTAMEIKNLVSFLDLVQSKGMKAYLMLVNNHIEEQPPNKNALWLGTILGAIKDHSALDLVLLDGEPFMVDTNGDGIKDACGIPAEAPLWEGSDSVGAKYVTWAFNYAHSLGLPWRKISAEAIVGDYYTYALPPSGPGPNGPHPYDPIHVLKGIFDRLEVPNDQRTYAISFYEHTKCSSAGGLPCVDENPHAWAVETIKNLFATIGNHNGARVVAPEMGLLNPVDPAWTTPMALESLVWIMQAYGIDGGCFWQWTDATNFEELNPTLASTIKKRGTSFTYNPVKDVLQNLYTIGQANDLSLTQENIPPAFSSVTVTPSFVENDKPFEITVDLGETHLFVTADISALDPEQTDPVVFTQVRDGVYQTTVRLNRWNAAPIGTKMVQINAMDFWSNTATTSVAITVKNPALLLDTQPPDDNFIGKVLNASRWNASTYGGPTISQDDRLIMTTASHPALSTAQVTSTWAFPGDFDVQVEFQIGAGWASPAHDHLDGAYLDAAIAGQDYRITRIRTSNQDEFLSFSTTGVLTNATDTTALAGRYRLVRSGTTLYLLFDVGDGWQELASTTVPSGPTHINLGTGSINASLAFTSYFDNFQINSGLTTYKP